MHNAPPVIYPVGRCALCTKAFYVVGGLQLLVLWAAAYASQPPPGARWPWWCAAAGLLLWLAANAAMSWRANRRARAQTHANTNRYLAWRHLGRTGAWQLQTQAYGEPTALATTHIVLDFGHSLLVRVRLSQDAPKAPEAHGRLINSRMQWLWLFERDRPARWPALRRALLATQLG